MMDLRNEIVKRAPTVDFINSVAQLATELEAELNDAEHPFDKRDRSGTRQRAAEELSRQLIVALSRKNDMRNQLHRWRLASRECEDQLLSLEAQVARLLKIQQRYHDLV